MSRSLPWRRACSDVVHWRQLQAIQARLYVLQESGPTAFIVKEHDSPKKLRVTLGDPSSCTCMTYQKERELCIHILWVVLKLFRIPPENPISWQGSLVEREIHQIVKSREGTRARAQQPTPSAKPAQQTEVLVEPRPIDPGDCCPICQDEMTPAQHLTYCRYSCGHSIHSRCMKIWADHQISQGTKILCPMCRADFGTLKMIMTDHLKQTAFRRDTHPGSTCNNCSTTPIQGKIYMCTICDHYHLCMQCFAGTNHTHHPFQFKEKPAHRWRAAARDLSALPPQLAAELENRDITENDYETLLTLDNAGSGATGGLSTKEIAALKSIMLTKNSSLLRQDLHCDVCLARFALSQHVVELPCSHKFHKVCAENWLAHTHDYCPTCTEAVSVKVPARRKVGVKRYNLKEEVEEEPLLEFSLAGSSVRSYDNMMKSAARPQNNGNSGNENDRFVDMLSTNVVTPQRNSVVSTRLPRGTRTKAILPSFVDVTSSPPSLSVGSGSNSAIQVSSQTNKKPGSTKKPGSRPPHAPRVNVAGLRGDTTTPPRAPRGTRGQNGAGDTTDLMVGSGELDLTVGAGGSPVDILRRISSVHERPSSRSASPQRRGKERRFTGPASEQPEIKPELVLVSGVRIS